MLGHIAASQLRPVVTSLTCGAAGYLVDFLENKIIADPLLRDAYAQNLVNCVFNDNTNTKKQVFDYAMGQDNPDAAMACFVHRALDGQPRHGSLAGNAGLRLRAAARTLQYVEHKNEILHAAGLLEQDLETLQTIKPDRDKVRRYLHNNAIPYSVFHVAERKQRAKNNLKGMRLLVKNANAHHSLSTPSDKSLNLTPDGGITTPFKREYML